MFSVLEMKSYTHNRTTIYKQLRGYPQESPTTTTLIKTTHII